MIGTHCTLQLKWHHEAELNDVKGLTEFSSNLTWACVIALQISKVEVVKYKSW